MANTLYRSSDAGAPSLSNAAGSLLSVLDACLITGYGSKAAAGWSKPFSGTSTAVYKQGAAGRGMLLRVDDSLGSYARVIGFESMADADTGLGPFPTETQSSGGLYWLKGSGASREWIVVADSARFWFASSGSASSFQANTDGCPEHFFGNFDSFVSGDAFDVAVVGNRGSTIVSSSINSFLGWDFSIRDNPAGYAARSFSQSGQAVACYLTTDGSVGRSGGYANTASYPDAASGGMRLARVTLVEGASLSARGVLPGLWAIAHRQPGQSGDTFSGAGALSGRDFLLLNSRCPLDDAVGRNAIETSNSWG